MYKNTLSKLVAGVLSSAYVLTVSAAPLADLGGAQTGRIEFKSITPAHRWSFARQSASENKPVVVYGDLLMPKTLPDSKKVPAVVMSHGSGGVKAVQYDLWAKELNAAGYAVFIVESFKPRGVERTAEQQTILDPTANTADALNALKLLATHPQIDRNHIAVMGFSRGGGVAWDSRWDMARRVVIDDETLRFYAHIPIYPGGCGLRYRFDTAAESSKAPVLLMLATKDDFDHAAGCLPMVEEINKRGQPFIQVKWYEGYHGFDVPNPWTMLHNQTSAKDCSIDIALNAIPRGGFVKSWDAKNKRELNTLEEFQAEFKRCTSQTSFATEGNAAATKQAVADVLEFLEKSKQTVMTIR